MREQDEGLFQLAVLIALRHLHCHDLEEVIVVDRDEAVFVLVFGVALLMLVLDTLDQTLYFLGSGLETQRTEGDFEVFFVYRLLLLVIEEVEGFLDVSLLLVGELSALATTCLLLLFAAGALHASTDETFLQSVERLVLLHFVHHVLLWV